MNSQRSITRCHGSRQSFGGWPYHRGVDGERERLRDRARGCLLGGAIGLERVAIHLHDRDGLGLANALAAFECGARIFVCAVSGLGGSATAVVGEGAPPGNIATEELVRLLEKMGVQTGVDEALLLEANRGHLEDSIGTLTMHDHAWQNGGRFELEIASVSGTPGTNWDLLTLTGTLDLGALSPGGFEIDVIWTGTEDITAGTAWAFLIADDIQDYAPELFKVTFNGLLSNNYAVVLDGTTTKETGVLVAADGVTVQNLRHDVGLWAWVAGIDPDPTDPSQEIIEPNLTVGLIRVVYGSVERPAAVAAPLGDRSHPAHRSQIPRRVPGAGELEAELRHTRVLERSDCVLPRRRSNRGGRWLSRLPLYRRAYLCRQRQGNQNSSPGELEEPRFAADRDRAAALCGRHRGPGQQAWWSLHHGDDVRAFAGQDPVHLQRRLLRHHCRL